ncbi:hypothetical protein ABTK41_19795, partial [Acinetobacter baumannii]
RIDVALRANGCDAPEWTPFVINVDYDARGQRVRVEHGNGAVTVMTYDPATFRLTRLLTTRPAGADQSCGPLFADGAVVQDLRYHYD